MRRLKTLGLAVIVLLAAVCAIGVAVVNFWPPFGGSLQGARAARALPRRSSAAGISRT